MAGKKSTEIIENVLVEEIGAEGNAISRLNNMVIFIPMVIPGDIVDIRIIRKRKKYMMGEVIRMIKKSPSRSEPFCEHFGICGGCKWQHLPYSDQLKFKEKQLTDALQRIGRIENFRTSTIIPSQKTEFYRNKLEYTFSSSKWFTREEIDSGKKFENTRAAGFHIPGMHNKVVDLNKCWLQEEPGNRIRNFAKDYCVRAGHSFYDVRNHHGFLRNLIIRDTSTGELMTVFSFGDNQKKAIYSMLNEIKNCFPDITSLLYTINTKRNATIYDQEIITFHGKDHITERLENLSFRIGPKSFFQTNTLQALQLYRKVREYAGLTGREIVYDLYTGTGTIANFIAENAGKLVGIDSIPEAIEDAKRNSLLNDISNTQFYTGDIKNLLDEQFIRENGKPDIIITDPPRAGMHRDVILSVLKAKPEKIIYVSCNPATQARDVELMKEMYEIDAVQAIDMFPHTHHVESIILLKRK